MMDEPLLYEIRVEGVLTEGWADWFEGLALANGPDNETILCGPFADQAALFGVLSKIQAVNLRLSSVNRITGGTTLIDAPGKTLAPGNHSRDES
jgi:hypothetical protein